MVQHDCLAAFVIVCVGIIFRISYKGLINNNLYQI